MKMDNISTQNIVLGPTEYNLRLKNLFVNTFLWHNKKKTMVLWNYKNQYKLIIGFLCVSDLSLLIFQ